MGEHRTALILLMVLCLAVGSILEIDTTKAFTEVTGIIASDTTWTKANSPYILEGPLLVSNGITLTIEPGVTVNLTDYYIQVNGTLAARGSSTDPIYINGVISTYQDSRINFTESSSNWNEQTGSGCIIENAILNSTRIDIHKVSPKINNNSILTNPVPTMGDNVGISIDGGSPMISSNNIMGGIVSNSSSEVSYNTITGGIGVYGGSPIISNNNISGGSSYFYIGRNWDRDYDVIAIYGDCTPIILNNTITGNSNGIGFDAYSGYGHSYNATIRYNVIHECMIGITIGSSADSEGLATISDNIIHDCELGIRISSSSIDTLTIERNLITNNTKGIAIGSTKTTVLNNTITWNSVGIFIDSSLSATITSNNIENSSQFNIQLEGTSNDVNATYNWWGTTNVQAINQSIFDFFKNFNLGRVHFVPFLTVPNSEATPIPEFPSWIILPLLIVVTLVVTVVRNRLKRKALASCLLLLLGISIFASVGFIGIAKANPIPFPEKLPINQVYIRSNGDIDPATLPIERSGNTYFLNGDIANYSIVIEKDGIVIDGNNCMLTLPSYGERGEDGQVKTAPALVSITRMSNITVKNLEFRNCETGISVINSSKISIIQNTIISKNGVYISSSGNCSITRNVINSTQIAINLHQSLHLDIEYNKITHHGTSPSGISYCITGNVGSSNIIGNLFSDYDIALYNIGSFNRIVGNSFENNFFGILHNAPALPFEGNEIYHNNFINNTHPLALWFGSSILDDGKEGNYWSNYNGTDNDGDGIGDTPLVIPTITIWNNETNIDHYPLMEPAEIEVIPEFPSWIILPLLIVATMVVAVARNKLVRKKL